MSSPSGFRCLVLWVAYGAALNLAWEIAQLPLYAIYAEADSRTIVFAIAHCVAGDALIAFVSFTAAAAAARSWRWPVDRVRLGGVVATGAGFGYTIFSEWLNVYVRESWGYSAAMPTLFGIGVSPLLQWLVIPVLALILVRLTFPRWQGSQSVP